MPLRPTDPSWLTWPEHEEALARTPVVLLLGGTSEEREVSLWSGTAMAEALASATPPQAVHRVEVTSEGNWIVDGEGLSPPVAIERLPRAALFVLGLHGSGGEDGRMQAFLELSGRRYTGAGPAASTLCMDKHLARLAAEAAGMPVSPAHLVRRSAWSEDAERELSAVLALGGGPWFVKPSRGGSSVGVSCADDAAALRTGIDAALEVGDQVLVEMAIEGLEVTVGVLGNEGQEPVLLPVTEILPKSGQFFDFDQKYTAGGATEICPPEHLSPQVAGEVQDRALEVYRATGCEGYARIDFIVGDGREAIFLEANTLPGFTARSILPLAAAATGVDFRGLCLELCARALARFEEPLS